MSKPRPDTNLSKAIPFILLAAFFNTIMIVFVKLASESEPTQVILFARYLITLIIVLPFIYYNPNKEPMGQFLKTDQVKLHLFRDVCGVISLFCYFYTAKTNSLATATVLFNTVPLFIPIIAYFWGGLKIMHRLWWGMGLGFLGVILIIQPSQGEFLNTSAVIGLLSGFFAALVFVGSRYLIYSEPPLRNMFYYFFIGTILTFIIVLINAKLPVFDLNAVLLLLSVGIFGYLYQLFFTYSARYAPVRLTSSFMYASVIISLFFDWFIWQLKPNYLSVAGILSIILGSCLMLILYPKDDYQKR